MTTFYRNNDMSPLVALSDFWQRLFVERDVISTLYQGTVEQLGQAYAEIMNEVLALTPEGTPLFDKSRWDLISVRTDTVVYSDERDMWGVSLTSDYRDIPWLVSGILDPTVALESGVDYYIDDGKLWFFSNPFVASTFAGAPTRTVITPPTVYASRVDGAVTAGGTTFNASGVVTYGAGARILLGSSRLVSSTAVFSPADVGRNLVIGAHSSDIVTVVSPTTVILADAAGASYADSAFTVSDSAVFSVHSVGRYIRLKSTGTNHKITAYNSALSVEISPAPTVTARDAAWELNGGTQVVEAVFWAPITSRDLYRLQDQFGDLVGRAGASTEAYRQLVLGVTSYLTRGPTIGRIESALNVSVGLPVVRENGETIVQVTEDTVVTNRRVYTVPAGSVKADLYVGQVLRALDSLTDVFAVSDRITDPTWWHGERASSEIIPATDGYRAVASPELRDLVIGSGYWRIGDPRLFVGADGSLGHVPYAAGTNAMRLSPYTVDIPTGDLKDEDVGKRINLYGQEAVITGISGIASSNRVRVSLDQDPTWMNPGFVSSIIKRRIFSVTASGSGPYTLTAASSSFWPADVGMDVRLSGVSGTFRCVSYISVTQITVERTFNPGPGPLSGTYTVRMGNADDNVVYLPQYDLSDYDMDGWSVSVGTPDTLYTVVDRLSKNELLLAPQLDATDITTHGNVQGFIARPWNLVGRSAIAAQTGYTLWHDYIQKHVFKISYNPNAFDLPYEYLPGDLDSVILRGKSAYVYMITSADVDTVDAATVDDMIEEVAVDVDPDEEFFVENTTVTSSSTRIGAWYATPRMPGEYIRPSEFGADVPLGSTGAAAQVAFSVSFVSADPADSIVFSLKGYTPNGLVAVETDIVLTADMPEYVVDTQGLDLVVTDVVFSGTATAPVLMYDLLCAPEQILIAVPPERASEYVSISAGVATATNLFVPGDVGRLVRDTTYTYVITGYNTPSSVNIATWPDMSPAPDAPTTEITWLGHVTWASPVLVGGNRPDVEEYVSGGGANEWPALVTLDYN